MSSMRASEYAGDVGCLLLLWMGSIDGRWQRQQIASPRNETHTTRLPEAVNLLAHRFNRSVNKKLILCCRCQQADQIYSNLCTVFFFFKLSMIFLVRFRFFGGKQIAPSFDRNRQNKCSNQFNPQTAFCLFVSPLDRRSNVHRFFSIHFVPLAAPVIHSSITFNYAQYLRLEAVDCFDYDRMDG